MEYKLIGNPSISAFDTVLKNRNIDNIDMLLNPYVSECHYSNLDNIDTAVHTFLRHCKNKSNILVIIDADVDGVTSSALICNYMRELGVEYNVYMHDGKQHGITDEALVFIGNLKPNLVIIPDASSSEGDKHKLLMDSGIDVIVLDHHIVEGESPAIIVNNQSSPNFTNKDLSGVGIVYKFCQAVDSVLNMNGFCNKFLDLVAVGNIADVMDLRNIETRMFCKQGLESIQNPLLEVIFDKDGITFPTILDIGFKVAPLMNAIIRVGTQQDKKMMFDALSGMQYNVTYKPRGKEETDQSLAEAVIRLGNNAKSRQRTLTKKAVEYIDKQIIKHNIINDKIIIVDVTGVVDKAVTGLVANKICSTYKRPAMLLHQTGDGKFTGSARSFGVPNLKDICSQTGLFELTAGHQESFGVEIKQSKISKFIDVFNDMFKNVEYNLCYDVDFIFEAKDLNKQIIESISEFSHIWGNGLSEPMFAVNNIRISSKDVRKLGINMVSFSKNGIYYIKNFATSKFIDELTCREEIGFGDANIVVDIVCKFTKSMYGTRVEIVDYTSKVDTELIF